MVKKTFWWCPQDIISQSLILSLSDTNRNVYKVYLQWHNSILFWIDIQIGTRPHFESYGNSLRARRNSLLFFFKQRQLQLVNTHTSSTFCTGSNISPLHKLDCAWAMKAHKAKLQYYFSFFFLEYSDDINTTASKRREGNGFDIMHRCHIARLPSGHGWPHLSPGSFPFLVTSWGSNLGKDFDVFVTLQVFLDLTGPSCKVIVYPPLRLVDNVFLS